MTVRDFESSLRDFWRFRDQDTFDHDKGQKSAISGRRLHWILLVFSSGSFCLFSPGALCNLVTKSPQHVERIALFPGEEKV